MVYWSRYLWVVLLLVLGIVLCPGTQGRGAEEVSFTASVDKEKVALDDRLVLTLTIVGARNATEPQLPALDAFKVISSGTTTQFNFIQGRMFSSRSFTYVLIPQKVGKFTIGPAQWDYEGNRYSTLPLAVEVVEGQAIPAPAASAGPAGLAEQIPTAKKVDFGDRLFIQVKTDKEEVYLNEQVILVFRLYRRSLSLDDLQYTAPPTIGFIEESLGKQKETRELINGVLYDVIELKTALFPASTGDLTIGPASLKCNILVRSQRRRLPEEGFFGGVFEDSFFSDPFFDRFTKYPVDLRSNPLTIRVKPLPAENMPPDFRSAVGDYQMEAWVKPTKLKVGEPVNLTMKIVGSGNVSSLSVPLVDELEGFKTYDSESKVNLQERIDVIGGEKVFEKVLIPQKAGKLKIPPVHFSFFNPRLGRYETLSEGPFWLDVEESAEGKASVVVTGSGVTAAKEDVQIVKRDILFIKEALDRVHKPAQEIQRRWYFWWSQAVPLLLLVGIVLMQKRRDRLGSDVQGSRFRNALAVARGDLKHAERLLGASGKEGMFYQALYKAVGGYISERWNLPTGEITPQEIRDVVVPRGMKPDLAQRTEQIIERINQGRFVQAAAQPKEMRDLLDQTTALIKDLQRSTR